MWLKSWESRKSRAAKTPGIWLCRSARPCGRIRLHNKCLSRCISDGELRDGTYYECGDSGLLVSIYLQVYSSEWTSGWMSKKKGTAGLSSYWHDEAWYSKKIFNFLEYSCFYWTLAPYFMIVVWLHILHTLSSIWNMASEEIAKTLEPHPNLPRSLYLRP